MTPAEICTAAMGLCSDYTDAFPKTRSIMYQRISARQREVFAFIAGIDPEYFGAEVVAEVVGGALNVAALEQSGDVYPVERIEEVRIEELEAEELEAEEPDTPQERVVGERVSLVRASDIEASLPPRATFRSGVIRQVGQELAGVTGLLVYYSRRPRTIGPDGAGVIELDEPYHFLYVYDLVKDLMRRTVGVAPELKAAVIEMVSAPESELMDALREHITHGARARESRFV